MSLGPHWRVGLALSAVTGYAALSHALMLHAADAPWAVAVLLGPLIATAFGVAARRRQRSGVLVCAALALGLAWIVAHGGLGNVQRLYVAQHAGVHLLLFATFAGSLRREGLSLIGELARRVHPLTPAMVLYTRKVTRVWAGYFVSMALLSIWVYRALPWEQWSLLANVITPAAIALVFIGEYLLRYRLHPEFERSSFLDAVRAYGREAPRA